MGCAAGQTDCCAGCASDTQLLETTAEQRAAILDSTRALIEQAAAAVDSGGECGSWGVFESATIFLTGNSDRMISSGEVCRRQHASVENLQLMYGQLEQLLAVPRPSEQRLNQLLDAIETSAADLLSESDVASWSQFARAYAAAFAQTLGSFAAGAADAAVAAAAGATQGLVKGLGLGWTLALLAGALWYVGAFRPRAS
jgi:hypothetical protein